MACLRKTIRPLLCSPRFGCARGHKQCAEWTPKRIAAQSALAAEALADDDHTSETKRAAIGHIISDFSRVSLGGLDRQSQDAGASLCYSLTHCQMIDHVWERFRASESALRALMSPAL